MLVWIALISAASAFPQVFFFFLSRNGWPVLLWTVHCSRVPQTPFLKKIINKLGDPYMKVSHMFVSPCYFSILHSSTSYQIYIYIYEFCWWVPLGHLVIDYFRKVFITLGFFFSHKKFLKIFPKLIPLTLGIFFIHLFSL